AIVGRPNVGKSSLFNALLGYERAIVTPLAGTTRDTLNETLTLGGLCLKMTDTAVLRQAEDEAEAAGIERAEAASGEARLDIGVFDGSQPMRAEDERTLLALQRAPASIAVINKSDLPRGAGDIPGAVPVSAKTGQGIDALAKKITLALKPYSGEGSGLLTNARHLSHIVTARDALSAAIDALDLGLTPDAVLTVLEEAESALASLMGKNLQDDVIGDIFSRFCVGK
ncbi:MAG: 50S ribosome-binding GTPase, partial [Oscillospiraceae bacterium]|nr:50S ribosome-binding GTPase [Oscillospiraceae bacterium]